MKDTENPTNRQNHIDKILLKFIADVLYAKRILCAEELEAIYDVKTLSDLDTVFEKMLNGKFNVYKRGETYDRTEPRIAGNGVVYQQTSCQDATVRTALYDGSVQLEQTGTTFRGTPEHFR
jgi:hypothetical protein